MADVTHQESNAVGHRIAQESTLGVLPGSPVWYPQETNGFGDHGEELTLKARRPLNNTRRLGRGRVVDRNAVAGYSAELTPNSLCGGVALIQGYLQSPLQNKDEITGITVVDGVGNDFEPAAGGDDYVANDLLWAEGSSATANNGEHLVTGSPSATSIPVTSSLTTTAGDDVTVRRMGFQFATGDAEIDASGTLPQLTTTTKDMTAFDISPGEWFFLGGDVAAYQFNTAANNGFKRALLVAANAITIDKSFTTMVTDAGTGKTIRIYLPDRVAWDQSDPANRVKYSYQHERSLGAPDDSLPAEIQGDYMEGSVANEIQFNVPDADFVTCDLSFVSMVGGEVTGAVGLKSGTRPAVTTEDPFDTQSSFKRIKLSVIDPTDENPNGLLARSNQLLLSDMTLNIKNGAKVLKSPGVAGGFAVNTGPLEISGSITGFFADIAAVTAIKNNSDVTLDWHLVTGGTGAKKGIVCDIPIAGLGGGKMNIQQDEPITIPLDMMGANGTLYDATFDHTIKFCFFSKLPDLADTL